MHLSTASFCYWAICVCLCLPWQRERESICVLAGNIRVFHSCSFCCVCFHMSLGPQSNVDQQGNLEVQSESMDIQPAAPEENLLHSTPTTPRAPCQSTQVLCAFALAYSPVGDILIFWKSCVKLSCWRAYDSKAKILRSNCFINFSEWRWWSYEYTEAMLTLGQFQIFWKAYVLTLSHPDWQLALSGKFLVIVCQFAILNWTSREREEAVHCNSCMYVTKWCFGTLHFTTLRASQLQTVPICWVHGYFSFYECQSTKNIFSFIFNWIWSHCNQENPEKIRGAFS